MNALAQPGARTSEVSARTQLYVHRGEMYAIFAVALALNLALAWWLMFHWLIGHHDALSRTANAFYVAFSRDPHLGAVGFVWPPLPSLLQLPLLPITRTFGHTAFAGPLLTCIFAALDLVLLNLVLAQLGAKQRLRWLLLAATQLNPEFWYLAASGPAETILLAFLLLTVVGYLMMPGRTLPYALTGVALGLGFFVRYEAVAMIPGVLAAVLVHQWSSERRARGMLAGRLVMLLLPPLYAIGLWLFWNWQIMGDPLFFQRSAYSLAYAPDVARVFGPTHAVYAAWGNLWIAGAYAVTRLSQQNIGFVIIVPLVLVLASVRRDRRLIGLVLLLLSVPAFTTLQAFAGTLPAWLRYWSYATPFAAILIAAFSSQLAGGRRTAGLTLLMLALVAAMPRCLYAMADQTNGLDEQRFSTYLLAPDRELALRARDNYWRDVHDAPELARRLDERSSQGLVLVDSVMAYAVILKSEHPERLLITNDRLFQQALADPRAYVRFILMLDPTSGDGFNAIAARYPQLYAEGSAWARLDTDFTGLARKWRLFRIQESAQ